MSVLFPAPSGSKYTTDEQATGDVWIDDKPIYRKVCTITVAASWGPVAITDAPVNIAHIIHADYKVTSISDNQERTPYYQSSTRMNSIVFQRTPAGNMGAYGCCTGSGTGYVIFEYTKNTD